MLKPIAAGERVVARIPIRFVRRAFRRVPFLHPEDGAEDYLERDRLHAGM